MELSGKIDGAGGTASSKENTMNQASSAKKAEYLLKSLLFDPSISARLREFAWPSESDRWYELVFALLIHVCDQPGEELCRIERANEIRKLVNYLGNLDHLQIGQLARISITEDRVDSTDDEAKKILAILRNKGISDEEALRALTLLCQIARGLEANYEGKIQRYLRAYGEAMLKDIPQTLSLTGISNDDIRHVFVYWLQSVANMPLSLIDSQLEAFCQKHGITTNDLFQAADKLDVNFSIVDDLVVLAEAREIEKKTEMEERQ